MHKFILMYQFIIYYLITINEYKYKNQFYLLMLFQM